MRQIAVYGKGGIGKSTISAHLSAALSLLGARVIQIGCDPKHDSTRLLTRGQAITTVLDYLRVTNPLDYRREDILYEGFNGIGCVEAGGPQPGVGCAGRGIITTFDLLRQFAIEEDYDCALYDVLGDVVCGGFAVPIRNEYADTIFIVTSGGFMSLYAANNILRGVKNYDQCEPRVAGILYNKGNLPGEDERAARFAEAVGLPIVATIPFSKSFVEAELASTTLIESRADENICAIFESLAKDLVSGMQHFCATPLEDDELEASVYLTDRGTVCDKGMDRSVSCDKGMDRSVSCDKGTDRSVEDQDRLDNQAKTKRYLSKNVIMREPLHGCAFNGAVSMCTHVQDAVVIAHAPKSCAYLSYQSISSTGRRGLFERGAILPVAISPNLECTNMNESDMVFGGMEALQNKLETVQKESPRAIIVVSACPAGIIGDDIEQVARPASKDDPAIVALKTDGNMTGDYLQGMLLSYTTLAQGFIQKDVAQVPNTINIVFEKVVARSTDTNYATIESLLSRMGVAVNCRFLSETTVDRLEAFCSAPLNLLAFNDYTGRMLREFFETEYGCRFLEYDFPVGFEKTVQWLDGVADFFGKAHVAEEIIAESTEHYQREIERLRPELKGKRLMIVTYNHDLDWILKTALDLGIEVVKLGILNFSQDTGFRTEYDGLFDVEELYDPHKRAADICELNPDIMLANYESSDMQSVQVVDTIPMCPDVGFFSGLNLANRWAEMLKMETRGEWMLDEQLYKKYYTG